MFEYNPIYKKYQRYNNYKYYNNTYSNSYNTTFNPMYNYFNNPTNIQNNFNEETKDNTINFENNPNINSTKSNDINNNNTFRIGPIQIEDNYINLFGFSIAIDDLIIIGLMILLFFQSEKDYTLLIILGLMLFNITFSNLDFFRSF